MDLVIRNGGLITGDGKTFHKRAAVYVRKGRIIGVDAAAGAEIAARETIDAAGGIVMPGLINAHAHGCIRGPSMPSGSKPFAGDDVAYFRNRHLLQGTTTLLNVCGLAMADEIDVDNVERHAMDIRVSTAHTPKNIAAALVVDGKGLSARHLSATTDDLLACGAVALGEAGGGQTLGGGAQEYRFIPQAFLQEFGVEVTPAAARRLKNAVLGRYLDPAEGLSNLKLTNELECCGLSGLADADRVRDIITRSVMPSVALSLAGFDEIAREAERLGYPAIFHNAAPSAKRLIAAVEKHPKARLVAGHSNHPSFLPEEAVSNAQNLRGKGAIIDVSTLDCIGTRWRNDPSNLDALIDAGCVDTISTDFAGGHWDGILEAIQRMVRKKQLSAAEAVALATGNVARVFTQMAGDRGLIEKGKRADLIVVDHVNLSRVRHVVIAGRIVVRNGRLI
ncbi:MULTISPECIES: amidohydrolase family protein [Ensifer]|uniref:Amidohydrolase family protein n=1 Tax=Ensifer adhaerens TaxID=106592 RepID=A0A9Q9DBZ3_ENSAD|nr:MULTISPECIES: amidohydrolase family protein [Ensifer]MBD9520659.1 amidohydrolase family protein [Ensifer sp. ENS02]MBD9625336.1 amidohydrolase family protein [Ensifer sp. ENS06]MCY1740288.1 amidohydrolase family protein [Ensifer sp. SL37]USJ25631.1 amidohydrolase family protein [Ensifer adhaerens]